MGERAKTVPPIKTAARIRSEPRIAAGAEVTEGDGSANS
jgi:hypothetical protein